MTGDDRPRFRLTVLGLVVLSLFGVLTSRLWYLQVLAGEEFAVASERNRVRIVAVEGPRGRIVDRNGVVLADNRGSLAVAVRRDDLPADAAKRRALLTGVSRLLGVSLADVERRLTDVRASPFKPVVIATDVSEDIVYRFRERQDLYPAVETLILPVRTYPKGALASHVIGYVGEIDERDLNRLRQDGYRLGDSIGKTGVERSYESSVRGRPGLTKLEVDATGRVLRTLGRQDPAAGSDLVLTLDSELQAVAEDALAQGMERARSQVFRETGERFRAPAGAAVVLEAVTGEIIAMASLPAFDVRRFVGGVDQRYWAFLNDADSHFPLLNRAVLATYPPGSTFKPIVAAGALDSRSASPSGRYRCTTEFEFGDRVFRNWQPRNAQISLQQALVESCDTVFYELGASWWRSERAAERAGRPVYETMQDWSRRFGLGTATGVDLPKEDAGRVPDREYRRSVWEANRAAWCTAYRRTKSVADEDRCVRGYLWRGGDAVNMSIGQGELLVTPLQLAVAYAAIANGGKVLQPRFGLRLEPPSGEPAPIKPRVAATVDVDAAALRYVQRALEAVPTEGTARFPFRGWPFGSIPVAAKTGSSEIAGKQPYSWFASYAPAGRPRYVVVSVVEEAGFGSQVSGPVVRRIMDHLFELPPTPIVFGTRSD